MAETRDKGPRISPEAIVIGALTFTAGLAWNEAAKAGITQLFPTHSETFWGQLVYALLVTVLVVLVARLVHVMGNTSLKVSKDINYLGDAYACEGKKCAGGRGA